VPAEPVAPIDGVTIRPQQTGGTDAVVAAVTAATLVPFVQALMSRAAESAYDWVRRRLRSGRTVKVVDEERHVAVVLVDLPSDDALRELIALDLDELPEGSVLRWDAAAKDLAFTPSVTRFQRPPSLRTSTHTSLWSELGNGNVPTSRNSGSSASGQKTPASSMCSWLLGST
jgi:hypothetical protein